MIVEKYWAGIARRLQIESGVMNALIPHQGEKGIANELTLSRLVADLLPPSIGVGTGVIFDSTGKTSSQTDIILFDQGQQPRLMAQTNQVMFPIETVRLAIEVKTRLSKTDIEEDFPGKLARLQALTPTSGSHPPFCLFAYSFADSDHSRATELSNLEASKAPALSCVVRPGYVRTSDRAGFVPLRSAEEGKQWVEPDAGQSGHLAIVDGTEYPVFMMGQYTGQRYVGDPGRALLIFCLSMLTALDGGAGRFDWLTAYTSEDLDAVEPVS